MKNIAGLILIVSFIMFFSACKKNMISFNYLPPAPVLLKATDQLRAGISKEVASILEKVYRDPDAYYEVNAAIYSSYYEDERVPLRDLLFPETSGLYTSKKFRKFHAREGAFRKRFNEQMEKGSFPFLQGEGLTTGKRQTMSSSENGLAGINKIAGNIAVLSNKTGVSIYFPYSENFTVSFAGMYRDAAGNFVERNLATIVATDREADEGIGRALVKCNSGSCFREVLVDDDYAAARPTHIVAIGAEPRPEAIKEPSPSPSMYRVYNGSCRVMRQLDRLISLTGNGGGSEIKIGRISGFLNLKNQQVTGFNGDMVTLQVRRGDIRNKKWLRVFSIWDPNWDANDKEQVYAVYEEDTEGIKSISGSLKTAVSLPGKPSPGKIEGEVDFEVSVTTQDEILTQRTMDRASYFSDALNDQGWAYVKEPNDFLPVNKDWPMFDGAAVWQYTLPFRSN